MSEMPPSSTPPGGSYNPPGGSYSPPPPPTGGGAPAGGDRQIMLVLSYLGILSLVPLLIKKDDAEVQWHAKNGVVLFGAEIVWICIGFFLWRLPFGVGCALGVVRCVVWLGFIALTILCIVKALQGQRQRIPVITDIAEKI